MLREPMLSHPCSSPSRCSEAKNTKGCATSRGGDAASTPKNKREKNLTFSAREAALRESFDYGGTS